MKQQKLIGFKDEIEKSKKELLNVLQELRYYVKNLANIEMNLKYLINNSNQIEDSIIRIEAMLIREMAEEVKDEKT